ncbi:hypothetical protein [Kitasatospora sp. NBC_01539]|uniref:hypothetical protein n=1 Tax=Kitasatospora sp. NBC_01539 TaxID=2903577 RepID=UPI0038602D8F
MINSQDLVGRQLLKVTTSWHHYPGIEPCLLHLWLHLDGLGPVRFRPEGVGLALDADRPHGPFDMGEHGRTAVEDDLPDFPLAPLVGGRVESVREVRYRDGPLEFPIGVAIGFTAGPVRILSLGDEIVVARDEHLGAVEAHLHVAAAAEVSPEADPV